MTHERRLRKAAADRRRQIELSNAELEASISRIMLMEERQRVAAAEDYADAARAARENEREACAALCLRLFPDNLVAKHLATAILARKA